MNLETFHQKLLGQNQDKTPKTFKLSETHKALYSAFDENKRGYRLLLNGQKTDQDRFLATFVMAFYMTNFPAEGKVIFIVSRAVEKWAIDQIRDIARHVYKSRKGASESAITAIDGALQRIDIGSRALQIDGEPERWVAYGFTNQDLLPPWMRGRLILK